MGVLLSKYGLRGHVQPLVEFGAGAEEWDEPVATSVMPVGGWR
jgi:hypothetical protein